MKTIRKIFYWVLGLIALLVIVGFLLPKNYKVEKVGYISSDPDIIYSLISNFQQWHLWAPWTKETDPTSTFYITGEASQVGSAMGWDGEKFGNGEMVLSELIPGQLVAYTLAFDGGKHTSEGRFIIENQGDSVKVTWIDQGDLGNNPISRYMGLMMENMMGPDFENGLAKLKTVAEARRDWPDIDETVIPEQTVILVLDSAGPQDYNRVMGKAFSDLYGFIKSEKLVQEGAPFATYIRWDSVTYFSVMNICIPVESAGLGKGRIQVQTIPEQKVVRAIYFGPYEKTEPVYRALDTYVKETRKTEAGGPSEIYITNPMQESDTMKWETHIVFPVK
jgi:effector-binding domain-containing protein